MVIATLDHYEGTASTYPLHIGVGVAMRYTEIGEHINEVCSPMSGVPLDRRAGCVTLMAIKSKMDIMLREAVLEQLLHHTLSICECVI